MTVTSTEQMKSDRANKNELITEKSDPSHSVRNIKYTSHPR